MAERVDWPYAWAADLVRRGNARGPAAERFQPKPESALALLDEAQAGGVPPRCVRAEADDGDQLCGLAGRETRQARDVGGAPPFGGVRSPQRRILGNGRRPYRTGQGARVAGGSGPPRGGARSVWRCAAGGGTRAWPRQVGGLRGERASWGQPVDRQDSWRHLSTMVALEERAGYAPWR